MAQYSISVNLAWQIAVMEATHAKLQYAVIEQVFIGILKLVDIFHSDFEAITGLQATESDLILLKMEIQSLEDLFSSAGLDRADLRQVIRAMIGKGNYIRKEKVIHRDERCKRYFRRGMELAKMDQSSIMNVLHLLLAIVEEPTDIINQALSRFDTTAEALRVLVGEVAESAHSKVSTENTKSATPLLCKFGTDLTCLAKEGKIDPLIGRKSELLRLMRILARRTQNNPVLVGDAGVGKTAIIRGLALRIAQGNIAPILRDRRVIELNMASLVSGAKYKGEFEERLLGVLDEIRRNDDIILFIDELHTVVGAGQAEGSMDAVNIMKPALSMGQVRCIGATTLDEYRKRIEGDSALARRFQIIMVEEPDEHDAIEILKGMKGVYEKHHNVVIDQAALARAVKLSARYIVDKRLPDKALGIIDEACSTVRINMLSFLEENGENGSATGRVTEDTITRVVENWIGFPVENSKSMDKNKIAHMRQRLKEKIIGQDEAVERLAHIIEMGQLGLRDLHKPMGIFLFLGPTGVGKTGMAKALAEFLFRSEDRIIRFDMSEFMEKHSVSKLIGAPPGYVGYDSEGQLTEKLHIHPYSIVLLDEIEKAHPEILNILLQVFDDGRLTDSKGRTADARNAIFIMTSNIGGMSYQKGPLGFSAKMDKNRERDVMSQVMINLNPEFLNRIDEVIIFRSLNPQDMLKITYLMLRKLKDRFTEQEIEIEFTEEAVDLIVREGYSPKYGARYLARTIERMLTTKIAEMILNGEIKRGNRILVNSDEEKLINFGVV